MDGEAPLNQELASRLIRRLASEIPRPADRNQSQEEHGAPTSALQDLTPREVDVLQLLAQGQTNPQIAETLVISRATAKVHVERIIKKLGDSDRTQAAVRALQLGLVET